MEKNKVIGLVVISLIVGILIGSNFFGKKYQEYGSRQMPDGSMMKNDNSMSGMMHSMNASLIGKTGNEFDSVFLNEMIVHHEGALDMAELVLATSKRPELIKLANEIISAQNKEIEMMKAWKTSWFGN